MAAAGTQTSQNGWPASASASAIDVISFPVNLKSGTKKISLARATGRSFVEIIEWWDKNIEPVTMIGGHNYREIRGSEGTGKLSNHSSGTAIDINWDKHPLAAVGTIPADKVGALRLEATKRGLRWGGDYRGRKDEMHFEVNYKPGTFAVQQQVLDTARGASKLVKSTWQWPVAALAGSLVVVLTVRQIVRRRRQLSEKPL
jgi:D-alanyl-D-alanine carboxypeptidase